MVELVPTQRLYFSDATQRTCTATVLAVTEFHQRPALVLSATVFYPEGGGQPADFGTLGASQVIDVQEHNDSIYHILAEPSSLQVGDEVTGTIDWERRFDHMQQHTGQHTLSGAFYRLWNIPTVSWHLGKENVTIDIAKVGLSEAEIVQVELLANQIIWQNVAVTAQFYSRAELEQLDIRKGTDRDGDIRIVSIGDFDRIGCGGTHVAATGQVGVIGIRRWETRSQQTRIEFVCGQRALADYTVKTQITTVASTTLSAKLEDIPTQLLRLHEQSETARHEITDLRVRLVAYEAKELLEQASATNMIVCARRDDRDANELRLLAQGIVEGGGVALLGGVVAGKAQLVFACAKTAPHDLNQLLKQSLVLLGGKGGGQRFLAQGAGPEVLHIDAALEMASQSLHKAE